MHEFNWHVSCVSFNAGLVYEFFGQNCSHTEALDGLGISPGSHSTILLCKPGTDIADAM